MERWVLVGLPSGRKARVSHRAGVLWWDWTAQGVYRVHLGCSKSKRGAMQQARNKMASHHYPEDSGKGVWKEEGKNDRTE